MTDMDMKKVKTMENCEYQKLHCNIWFRQQRKSRACYWANTDRESQAVPSTDSFHLHVHNVSEQIHLLLKYMYSHKQRCLDNTLYHYTLKAFLVL